MNIGTYTAKIESIRTDVGKKSITFNLKTTSSLTKNKRLNINFDLSRDNKYRLFVKKKLVDTLRKLNFEPAKYDSFAVMCVDLIKLENKEVSVYVEPKIYKNKTYYNVSIINLIPKGE